MGSPQKESRRKAEREAARRERALERERRRRAARDADTALNRTAGPVFDRIRAALEEWYQHYRHLDRTLRTYAEHYNRGRPHRALGLAPPLPGARDPIPVSPRDVRRRDLLGGLIHEYHAAAA